jgi:hypothetical protein
MSTAPQTLRRPFSTAAFDPSIANLPPAEKLGEAIRRSTIHMGPEAVAQVQALLAPQSLAFMAGLGAAWLASHAFGVGEVADLLLIVGGGAALGWSVFTLAEELFEFFQGALTAKSSRDLDAAGEHFARAVAIGGVTLILSLVVKGRGASLRKQVPKLAGPPPPGTSWFTRRILYKPTTTADPYLPPGDGGTTPYGDVEFSSQGTKADQDLARYHERIHQLLSPRLRLFQELRADLSQHMYDKSVLLRYLEEAAAETYAQLRVNGLSGLMDGLKFPVKSPNYAITWVKLGKSAKGLALGTITVGGTVYTVYLIADYIEARN